MTARAVTADQANAIWDVLVQHAGAHEGGREAFVDVQGHHVPCTEYRFCGALGFGGKFWNYNGRWYVTAYPEDVRDRPGRQAAVDATNQLLAALHAAQETAA